MNSKEVIISQLGSGDHLLELFTKDFAPAEYLVALPNGGQTALWIFCHLAVRPLIEFNFPTREWSQFADPVAMDMEVMVNQRQQLHLLFRSEPQLAT